jgi:diazepam-binding inhibitor (GABA receptor modulating acyl-CoA-binding protein)
MNFEDAVVMVRQLNDTPDEDELLILYGLYKQITEGNCGSKNHNFFDLKARKKYNAWAENYNRPQFLCKKKYIEMVQSLVSKYGIHQ